MLCLSLEVFQLDVSEIIRFTGSINYWEVYCSSRVDCNSECIMTNKKEIVLETP